ncbi:MAG: hypothetical protein P1U62_14400 [Alteraurantiacibacter sp. bin_em_oilr2.035]|nr:hypothetical protein [Alteraurantiacibacter sp. bin_em_oilr2.035]
MKSYGAESLLPKNTMAALKVEFFNITHPISAIPPTISNKRPFLSWFSHITGASGDSPYAPV